MKLWQKLKARREARRKRREAELEAELAAMLRETLMLFVLRRALEGLRNHDCAACEDLGCPMNPNYTGSSGGTEPSNGGGTEPSDGGGTESSDT